MGKLAKSKDVIKAADSLSLGISIVVAILLGFGIGYGLKKLFGIPELIWVGLFIGFAASILNVYKAYKEQVASYDELKSDPRYKDQKFDEDEDDD
ncbi:MAG: AtpZ/AtpI family protein [Thiovulaceae bacterium]|nr:AtpZ/AtpI family protein [Sulfurimonadaceae bacterium]